MVPPRRWAEHGTWGSFPCKARETRDVQAEGLAEGPEAGWAHREALTGHGWEDGDQEPGRGHASCHHCSHRLPAPLQKLTMDLTAVLGVLQSQQPRLQQGLQQGAHSAGSSRLYDLYWQAMKFLGVQYVRGEGAPTLGGAGKTLTLHTS